MISQKQRSVAIIPPRCFTYFVNTSGYKEAASVKLANIAQQAGRVLLDLAIRQRREPVSSDIDQRQQIAQRYPGNPISSPASAAIVQNSLKRASAHLCYRLSK